MNGTNSTLMNTLTRMALLVMVLFTVSLTQVMAQPSCACKGSIQVSVDADCQLRLVVRDVLASTAGSCDAGATITLMKTAQGDIIPDLAPAIGVAEVDGSLLIGKTIYAKVTTQPIDGKVNSCWTTVYVEDKIKPSWANNRPDTCIVTCPSLGTFVPRAIDNCHTPRVYQVSESIVVNDCTKPLIFAGPDTLKCITREYRAIDESGNVSDSICKVVIYVTAIDDLIWPKNSQLFCEEDYAKIPSGPFAGHPSPVAIDGKKGSGVPSLYPWLPTTKNATYWIGRSGDGLRDSVSLSTRVVPPGSPASAQVCLTAPANITLRFKYGSIHLPAATDSAFYTINGDWKGGRKGVITPMSGTVPAPFNNIPLLSGQTICVNLVGSGASLTFGLDTLMTGIPLLPENSAACNLFVTYTDQKFPTIKCVTKILRRWTFMEWSCNSRIITRDQLIEIIDNKGPGIHDLKNDIATTNGHSCEGLYKLQKPRLTDNCSDDLKYNVTIKDEEGKPVSFIAGLRLSDADRYVKLPLGCDSIFYTAFDGCHNSTEVSIVVRVEDNTPPVAVCKQNTVVGLTDGGKAWVPASSFDNGSYDECDLAKVLVRRMDPTPCQPCKAPIIPGFTYIGEHINPGKTAPHHYYVSKHRANPRVAAKTAAAVGGYLVHLNNAAENKWVDDKYREWNIAEDYIIGLRDALGKGEFSWFSGQSGTYRNWAPGYPVDTIITPLNHRNDSIYVRSKYSTWTSSRPARWVNFDVDNCDADEYLYIVEVEDPCGFSEYVEFCCNDVTSTSPKVVVLRAIDKSGNWNECMVNATVQDKLPLELTCPPNQIITCDYPVSLTKEDLRTAFGYAELKGNCSSGTITDTFYTNLTSCRIGTIRRVFTATRGTEVRTCTQIIWVGGRSGYTGPRSWPKDTIVMSCGNPEDDAFRTSELGKPDLSGDNVCSLVGYKHHDDIFYINNSTPDACFKILRTHTVIDWCKFYPNTFVIDRVPASVVNFLRSIGGTGTELSVNNYLILINSIGAIEKVNTVGSENVYYYPKSTFGAHQVPNINLEGLLPGIGSVIPVTRLPELAHIFLLDYWNTWERLQTIKVADKVAPAIVCPPAKTVCTYDPSCVGGFIELSTTATDACTQELRWYYRIDKNNDGSFDSGSQYNKTGIGNSIDASGTYPIGTHKIEYTFEDKCGNLSKCEQLFTIKNCKAPTPYCLNGLATTLMPVDSDNNGTVDGGMVDVWATDFDNGSSHPCPGYKVAVSFAVITANADGTPKVVNRRTYTCDSIITGVRRNVRIYIAAVDTKGKVILDDNNKVVQDYCSTFIDVQNNLGACGSAGRIVVNGSVMTENEIPVKDVSVSLEGSEKTMMTGNNGTYNFSDVTAGGSYLVKPFKNDDHMNGISTLDLVMIQRHILGIEKITSPYKLIAADVNKDKNISAADLTELRKLILGINDKFTNNNSWRFVDKAHKFTDVNSAQAEIFPELYSLTNAKSNMKIDFMSIKVGDVNGNVTANSNDNRTESRSAQNFALNTVNASFNAGQIVEVPVIVAEANSVTGFQFTVGFDAEKLSLEGIDGDIVGMTDNNFGFTNLADGLLSVSYNKEKAMDMQEGDRIIKLTFKAKANGTLSEVMNINSDITKAEAYTGSHDVMNVNFKVVNRVADGVVLHQNTPNPFKANTVIGFELPKAMSATITIYDVTGKMLREYKDEFSKGYNNLEINKNELGSVGVMYYTLEAGDFKATKKMVVIE
ncbi:MAG: T9SS type A sorting domain-containing protein [Saprospiraceae bacterium]|nr:T9SS type A sorting domain-containing protein [Saprospiraceae bacterium]